MLTMWFPDEIANYEGVDEVMLVDDYVEELLQMVISKPEPDSALSDFCVLALRDDADASLAPAIDVIRDDVIVDIASLDILGHVVGESDSVAHHFLLIFCQGLFPIKMMYLPFHLWI